MDEPMGAFGLPATVTVAGWDPVVTTVFWLPPVTEAVPIGADVTRRAPLDVLVLRKNEVPTAPKGTVVAVAYRDGQTVETWTVDGFEHGDADHHRLIMRRALEDC